jgi:hypothetical protein
MQHRTLGEEFHHFKKENGHEKGDEYLTYLLRVLETYWMKNDNSVVCFFDLG